MKQDLDKLIEAMEADHRTHKRNNERYANDPAYREARITAAKQWAKNNSKKKRVINKKWYDLHGAKNARDRRARKKQETQCSPKS